MTYPKYYDGTENVELGKDDLTQITPESIGASPDTHNHDADYSDINHNHDADYSDINHNHDADYQSASSLIRDIHVSTHEPTALDGSDGDLWFVYEV